MCVCVLTCNNNYQKEVMNLSGRVTCKELEVEKGRKEIIKTSKNRLLYIKMFSHAGLSMILAKHSAT